MPSSAPVSASMKKRTFVFERCPATSAEAFRRASTAYTRAPRSASIDAKSPAIVSTTIAMKHGMIQLSLASVACALVLGGCANRYKIDTEAPNYAAVAKIKVKVNDDDNREMSLRIDHLAPPEKFPDGYNAYAVWIAVPGHGISKVGLLDYSSKRRRGELLATSPYPKFEVIVTLERDRSSAQPSGVVVLRKIVAGA